MTAIVSMSRTYYYEVELPDWFMERDEDGGLVHEELVVKACYEADPTVLDGVEECELSIDSIYRGDETFYYSH